jgi:hypothetical protein
MEIDLAMETYFLMEIDFRIEFDFGIGFEIEVDFGLDFAIDFGIEIDICARRGATAREVATPIGVNLRESNPCSVRHATTTKQKPELYQEVKQHMTVLFNALYEIQVASR